MNRYGRDLLTFCLVLLVAVTTVSAQSTVIRLSDGTRWRGELNDAVMVTFQEHGVDVQMKGRLIRHADLYVVIEGNVAGQVRQKTIFKGDLQAMKTVDADGAAGTRAPARPKIDNRGRSSDGAKTPEADQPGVFVLPLSGMVGLEFRHEEMEKIAEEADKHGPGQIIVLLIESGGGAVTEMEQIHETLVDIKKRHRLVAWIKEAISAACATAIHCDEIYFMTEGTAGSMTAFAGGQSWQGEQLQKWLNTAGEWMELGGRSRYIGEAMIDDDKLVSYDKDEKTGKVTWYNDLSGEFILSRMDENLTFNSSNALHSGFADGIADTESELAELLDLPKWHEVSDYGREIHEDWMSTVERAQKEIPRLADELQYKNQSSGDPIKVLGTQIQIMKQLVQWWDRAPNVCKMSGMPPKDVLERQIAEMKRELARMKKNR